MKKRTSKRVYGPKKKPKNYLENVGRTLGLTPEVKYYQARISLTPTSGGGPSGVLGMNSLVGGVFTYMNNIRQGAADGQRVGKYYLIKNISYSWNFIKNTTPLNSNIQMGILIDNSACGTFVDPNDAFDNAGSQVACMIKSDHTDKYKILVRHWIHTADATLLDNEWNPQSIGSGFLSFAKKPGGGMKIECYNKDNGNVADVLKGAIYFYLWGDTANIDYYMNFNFRIKYTDA